MTVQSTRARLRAAEQAYNAAEPGRNLTEARHELTHARSEYQAACVALVERLGDVLEPFHAEAVEWHQNAANDAEVYVADEKEWKGIIPCAPFNLGDLRRLSSIYKEITDEA